MRKYRDRLLVIKDIRRCIAKEDYTSLIEYLNELSSIIDDRNKEINNSSNWLNWCHQKVKPCNNYYNRGFANQTRKSKQKVIEIFSDYSFIQELELTVAYDTQNIRLKEELTYCEDIEDYTEEEYFNCHLCDETNYESYSVEDDSLCLSCYEQESCHCDGCEQNYYNDHARYFECSNRCYCESCEHQYISYCEDHDIEYDSSEYCERCDSEGYYDDEDDESIIKNYSYKVEQEFYQLPNEQTKLFYGIEVETEIRKNFDKFEVAEDVLNLFKDNQVILKEDSSIGNNGFEIVSNTATFNYHKTKLWENFFGSDIRDKLRSFHAKNTGLHIHCSKEFYTKADIGKIVVFLNLPYNSRFITNFAGRNYNQYCKRDKFKKITNYESNERFEALNLTNRNTIEFRIFKGNLQENSFFRYLEFVDCLSYFVKQTSFKTNSLKYWHLIKYIQENTELKKRYSNLFSWLKIKGYFDTLNTKVQFSKDFNVKEKRKVA